MDWYKIIVTIGMVICGYLVTYFKTKSTLIEEAKGAINSAENAYADVAKAGGQKMEWVINYLYNFVPIALKPFIPREMIQNLVQAAFDSMKKFADSQLDKIVDNVIKPEEE